MTRFKLITLLTTNRPRGHPREERPARLLARWAGALVAALALMLSLGPGIAAANEIQIYGNMCLDDPGGSQNAGQRLMIWKCWGGANQQWDRLDAGYQFWPTPWHSDYVYRNRASGYCLDVSGGALAVQWYCYGNLAQKMYPQNSEFNGWRGFAIGDEIQNLDSTGYCLDNQWNRIANGNPVNFYTCNWTQAQDWVGA